MIRVTFTRISNLKRVFFDFLNFTRKFPELSFAENVNSEQFQEDMNVKKTRFLKIREELNGLTDINDVESALLWNLSPKTIEEAIAYVPTL